MSEDTSSRTSLSLLLPGGLHMYSMLRMSGYGMSVYCWAAPT